MTEKISSDYFFCNIHSNADKTKKSKIFFNKKEFFFNISTAFPTHAAQKRKTSGSFPVIILEY